VEVIRLTRSPIQPWAAYLAAGFVAVGVYYALPRDSAGQGLLYDGIGLSAALAIVAGTLLHRPARRLPWYLLAAGLLAFSVGDMIFNLYANVWHRDPPLPSAADVFYLSGYPFLAAGLVLLIGHLDRRRQLAGLVDAAIFAVAFALVQWVFLMDDVVHGEGSTAFKAVSISYPAMDIVLVGGLAFFFLSPGWRTTAYRFIGASLVLQLAADEIYATSPDSYVSASWLDAGWLLSYVLFGTAALHPSMKPLTELRERHLPNLHPARIAFLGAALLMAPVVIVIQRATDAHIDAVPIAVAAAILPLLVPVRLAILARGIDRLRRDEREARSEAEFAQRLLAEQNERLRESDRLKDEFVALISHDLRTPLTSIMGYLELAMDDDTLGADPRRYLEVVQRNSERLLRLVNDLLFVARLEAGELDLHPAELDLGPIVRQSVEEARPRAGAKGIELACEAHSAPEIRGDRGRLFQLLDNLISNAIKFTPEGGRVAVRLFARGSRARIEVADTGIGIPRDEQARLFQRFFRARMATEQQIPGTGLGLYIASAIVTAHEGEIEVVSEPGEGTTFCIDLPALSPAERVERELVG
jgi:signal transduction histidine kinase